MWFNRIIRADSNNSSAVMLIAKHRHEAASSGVTSQRRAVLIEPGLRRIAEARATADSRTVYHTQSVRSPTTTTRLTESHEPNQLETTPINESYEHSQRKIKPKTIDKKNR